MKATRQQIAANNEQARQQFRLDEARDRKTVYARFISATNDMAHHVQQGNLEPYLLSRLELDRAAPDVNLIAPLHVRQACIALITEWKDLVEDAQNAAGTPPDITKTFAHVQAEFVKCSTAISEAASNVTQTTKADLAALRGAILDAPDQPAQVGG
jgi:hypothetical protein